MYQYQNTQVGDVEYGNIRTRLIRAALHLEAGPIRCARGLMAYSLFDMYGPLVIAPLEVLKNPLQEKPF